jgi:triphosphoribosyl-dephospho-CoA synthase
MPTPLENVGLFAQLACIWEATARKAGNVHPDARFDDLTYLDFLHSAVAIGPTFAGAPRRRVGIIVLEAVRATRRIVRTNTNLGIVLLLAPLAVACGDEDLRVGLAHVLADLDQADARLVYTAIRLAGAGGLGEAPAQDVRAEPTLGLRDIMALAQDRDLIARQYANGFREVFEDGVPALVGHLTGGLGLEEAIVATHLELIARHGDTLIARKRGAAEAGEASARAAQVLQLGWPADPAARRAFSEFDAWLRAEGNARNPGATADLVTACLFVALVQGHVTLPVAWSQR